MTEHELSLALIGVFSGAVLMGAVLFSAGWLAARKIRRGRWFR